MCLKSIEEDYRCWRCLYKRWRPRKGAVHVGVQVSVDWCFGPVDWWMPRSVVQVQCRDQSTALPVQSTDILPES